MATCLSSIGTTSQIEELTSEQNYSFSINQNINKLFLLSNELDQSVFFNFLVLSSSNIISITVTIYNSTSLKSFGSLSINSTSVNTSFNIPAGEYYICVRPLIGTYDMTMTPTFISYSNSISLRGTSYIGSGSSFELEVTRRQSACNRPLVYTMLEGELPTGLTLLSNGLVQGYLPMLNCDPKNADLPSSAGWYHMIGDSESVTNWGRQYRFKVLLTLSDDTSKTDEQWFYVSVLNDYSKNIMIVDQYKQIDDKKITSFIEIVKLEAICPTYVMNTIEVESYEDNSKNPVSILAGIKSGRISVDELSQEQNNIIHEYVSNYLTSQDETDDELKLFEYESKYSYQFDSPDQDLIELPSNMRLESDNKVLVINNNYSIADKGLIDYYIENIDANDRFIFQLYDSILFANYLDKRNVETKYINTDIIDQIEYVDTTLDYETIVDEYTKKSYYYIRIVGTLPVTKDVSPGSDYDDNYNQIWAELPLQSWSAVGATMTGELL